MVDVENSLVAEAVVENKLTLLTNGHVEGEPTTVAADNNHVNGETPKPSPSPLTEEFDSFVQKTLDQWHIQGMSIAVVHGDDTWTKVSIAFALWVK